jgi:hypothetical protein
VGGAQLFGQVVAGVGLIEEDRQLEVGTILSGAPLMKTSELMELFSEWVRWSTSHRYALAVRNIIKSLPRGWVWAHIESAAEPLLQEGADAYRRILELYNELDRDLTLRLALQAVASLDEDIREAGGDFIKKLQSN